MRYAIAAILLLFSVSVFGQLDQFRMVGSGSWSVVNDSTYSATVTFASDLTANSFLPTGVVDSMRVFTQRGQLYTIDSVGAKTFSTAVIYAVEYGGDWGSPSGQVLVYETRGRETVPAIPFATNGATSKLQEAVVTHNAAINNGVSTTQLADSTTAAKTYTNNQIAAVAPVKDTIVQASHGFSVGDPIWYSGDYLLSLDTGLTVRVDGVVSAVPDINTFVLQRTGRFTLTSHGFTVGVQLYVQPDGSYSATDTSNALVYGYPIDANTIEIGLKGDQIARISNKYKGTVFGSSVTRDQAIDSVQKQVTNINLDIDETLKVYYPNAESTFGSLPSYGLIPIYNNNGSFGKAQPVHKDSLTDLFIIGYPGTDTMLVQESGRYVYSHGLGQGKDYYLGRFKDTSQTYAEYYYDHLFTTVNDTVMSLGLGIKLKLRQGSLNSLNENYRAVLDYITTNTLTEPSDEVKEIQNNLVSTLDTAGLWDGLSHFYVFSAGVNDEDVAKLNWRNLGNETPSVLSGTAGALTFDEQHGYAVNNSIASDTRFGVTLASSFSRTASPFSMGTYFSILNMPGAGNYWAATSLDGQSSIGSRNNVTNIFASIRGTQTNGPASSNVWAFDESVTLATNATSTGNLYSSHASASPVSLTIGSSTGSYTIMDFTQNIGGDRVWTSVSWLDDNKEFTEEEAGIINTAIKTYYTQLQLLY